MNALTDVIELLASSDILSTGQQPLFIKDNQGKYCFCNDSFANTLGLSKNKILGSTAFDLFPIAHAELYTHSDRELFGRAVKKQEYSGPIATRGSNEGTAVFKKNVIFSRLGNPIGFVGTFDLVASKMAGPEGQTLDGLTKKESDILKLLVKGYSNKKIAFELMISQHTVASHMKSIYAKLHVHSKTEAVYKALVQLQLVMG